jgi:hypothetical protein
MATRPGGSVAHQDTVDLDLVPARAGLDVDVAGIREQPMRRGRVDRRRHRVQLAPARGGERPLEECGLLGRRLPESRGNGHALHEVRGAPVGS